VNSNGIRRAWRSFQAALFDVRERLSIRRTSSRGLSVSFSLPLPFDLSERLKPIAGSSPEHVAVNGMR
jgi:hypothetical protein